MPYTPNWSAMFAPLTQVQLVPSNFQRSFRFPELETVKPLPNPPNSQKMPPLPVHVTEFNAREVEEYLPRMAEKYEFPRELVELQ